MKDKKINKISEIITSIITIGGGALGGFLVYWFSYGVTQTGPQEDNAHNLHKTEFVKSDNLVHKDLKATSDATEYGLGNNTNLNEKNIFMKMLREQYENSK